MDEDDWRAVLPVVAIFMFVLAALGVAEIVELIITITP